MIRERSFPASARVSHAVERYSVYGGFGSRQAFERVFPNGHAEITINLTDGELRCYDRSTFEQHRARGPLLSGQQLTPYLIDTAQLADLVSVRLRAGGLWSLFGIPADEFTGRHLALEELFGPSWSSLQEQLQRMRDPGDRIRAVETALGPRRRAVLHPAVQYALERIHAAPATTRVLELARVQGMSFRRFNEVFKREVGISAKQYARVRRFQGVLRQLQGKAHVDWSRLAEQQGYADQAHLIREFGEFTGYTPGQYLFLRAGLS